jgi:hypothetical protein
MKTTTDDGITPINYKPKFSILDVTIQDSFEKENKRWMIVGIGPHRDGEWYANPAYILQACRKDGKLLKTKSAMRACQYDTYYKLEK